MLVPQSEPNTTILDPVENVQKIGLRAIISSEQADQILAYATDAKVGWTKENAKRKTEYAAILKEGSFNAIAKMIKELMVQSRQVSLNQSDRILLQNAQKKLLSVIALAKDIDLDQAMDELSGAIELSAS